MCGFGENCVGELESFRRPSFLLGLQRRRVHIAAVPVHLLLPASCQRDLETKAGQVKVLRKVCSIFLFYLEKFKSKFQN